MFSLTEVKNPSQILFVHLHHHHIRLILVLLALQSRNSENYFSSEWKRDTWKIFLYLAEYFLEIVVNVQCVVS